MGRGAKRFRNVSAPPAREGDGSRIPRHVAIIMDGNGRWATQRGIPRNEGHRAGAERVKEIVDTCLELGIEYLTIYAFSTENWRRPKSEVDGIMKLAEFFFVRFFGEMRDKGVYFIHLGSRKGLPGSIIKIIDTIEKNNTSEIRMNLSIAFNYGGRAEITDAFKRLGERVLKGELNPGDITEDHIRDALYTKGIPDPDLLIRTGGEMRLSNFLVWQSAYSELWITDTLWPDFTKELFLKAIADYGRRERRFGGLGG
jgi:undecaprenyl diphosphate synthase